MNPIPINRIAFVGRLGSGKTTASEYLVNEYGFKRYSFAAKLKEICAEMFPDKFEGGTKPRELLQFIGTDAFRKFDADVWVKYLVRRIRAENPALAVIDDCRFPNEAEALRTLGFTIVKIERSDRQAEGRGTGAETHVSELLVDKIRPDIVLSNNASLDSLFNSIDLLLAPPKQTLYLAHSFAKALTVREWELGFESRTGISLFNPFYEGKERELFIPFIEGKLQFGEYINTSNWKNYVDDDLSNIQKSDGILALIYDNVTQIGTIMEINEAWHLNKPIYVVIMGENTFLQHHWFLKRVGAKVFSSQQEFEVDIKA